MKLDPAPNIRVLVVDDNPENIRVLHQILKDEYAILFAVTGANALRIADEQLPDLILLDASMPVMDGFAVAASLKDSPRTSTIPIIFVTALNSSEDETRAFAAGAVDFISKPVNAATVRARVRTHITIKQQADLLRAQAHTDGLTGIANRRHFDIDLTRSWRNAERTALPLSLIMADVDHFKLYNDHYGHHQGDKCLKAVATALGRALHRPPDLIARFGGEEFVALLPNEAIGGARTVAQRLLSAVRDLRLPHTKSPGGYVTVSLGLASCQPQRDLAETSLIATADAKLYQAKAAGRDRFCD